jgi:hypothetical protein
MPPDFSGVFAKCTDRVYEFYKSLDERNYEVTAAQFHPEGGVFHRRGLELRTKEQILEVMNKRPLTLVIAHVITNLQLQFDESRERVLGRCYLTTYRYDSGNPAPSPAPLTAPSTIHESVMELRPLGNEWLLASLRVHKAIFESSPH